MESYEDYDVYSVDTGNYLGSVELEENATVDEMPDALEINGFEYYRRD